MKESISPQTLDSLREINSPTISNAIELFEIRPRNAGFLGPEIKCMFPDLGVMVGYATTVTMMAEQPAPSSRTVARDAYWKHILEIPEPRVAVVLDLDRPPCVGSFWGEVNSSVHRALGVVGTITQGGVRDLDEMHSIGFHTYAMAPIVSHSCVHIVEIGIPVKVGGVVINPGDLIHADKHGAIIIPKEIANEIPSAAHELDAAERILINEARSGKATLESLTRANAELRSALESLQKKYSGRS